MDLSLLRADEPDFLAFNLVLYQCTYNGTREK